MLYAQLKHENSEAGLERLREALASAEAVVAGAGSGLSAAAGFDYTGARFHRHFADFERRYGFHDMYSGGFFRFPTPEERWAFWSRHIMLNRYTPAPKPLYNELFTLLKDKDYFVITTNVDHQFQQAGFDKQRLFYTQGDYGLFQCSLPCCQKTFDNEEAVRQMAAKQKDMRVPSELVPRCPVCGRPVSMNLRADDTFVEDEGWHLAAERYERFLRRHDGARTLFLELGVGMNTPSIIKFSFWEMTQQQPNAVYACVNIEDASAPRELADRAIAIKDDLGSVIKRLRRQ